jgi:hypothetical protein
MVFDPCHRAPQVLQFHSFRAERKGVATGAIEKSKSAEGIGGLPVIAIGIVRDHRTDGRGVFKKVPWRSEEIPAIVAAFGEKFFRVESHDPQ